MFHFSANQAKVLLEQIWAIMPSAIGIGLKIDDLIKRLKQPRKPQQQPIISLPEGNTPERNRICAVIISATRHKNQPADNSLYEAQIRFLFASLSSLGFIAFPIKTGWISEESGLFVEEPGFLVLALTTQAEMEVGERMIKQFALYLKRELDQDAIAIIIGGNLRFI